MRAWPNVALLSRCILRCFLEGLDEKDLFYSLSSFIQPLQPPPPPTPPLCQQPSLSIPCAVASPLPALHSTAFSLLLSVLLMQLAEEAGL